MKAPRGEQHSEQSPDQRQHAEKPGSGLGLAIARRIAKLLGGDITDCAEGPQGARFTLWLVAASNTTPRMAELVER